MARPRRYDYAELRVEVIRAARILLQEGGPAALTARALSKAVGVTSGTIYGQFGDLHAVLLEVNRDTFNELTQMIEALPNDEPEPWLYALAEGYVEFMLSRHGVWQGLFEGPRVTEKFPDWYMETIQGLLARIAKPLAQIAPATDAFARAEELFVAVHGGVALAAVGRLDMVSSRSANVLAREAVATMICAISKTP